MNETTIEWVAFMVAAGLVSRGVDTTDEIELVELKEWLASEKAQAVRDAVGMFSSSKSFPRETVQGWLAGRADSIEASA